MLNSSEYASYWYLRLNGFFLIGNFVIHQSRNIKYSSDSDLLALRTPFVYEEVGGKSEDWDNKLLGNFHDDALIGLIVQVKGGTIGNRKLFQENYLSYNIQRLGFTNNISNILEQFQTSPIATITNELNQNCQIAKLLITRDKPKKENNYLCFSLYEVYEFIQERIKKYPKEKYRDRNFFSSIFLQTLIESNNLQKR